MPPIEWRHQRRQTPGDERLVLGHQPYAILHVPVDLVRRELIAAGHAGGKRDPLAAIEGRRERPEGMVDRRHHDPVARQILQQRGIEVPRAVHPMGKDQEWEPAAEGGGVEQGRRPYASEGHLRYRLRQIGRHLVELRHVRSPMLATGRLCGIPDLDDQPAGVGRAGCG
jgi:hypothetical protein